MRIMDGVTKRGGYVKPRDEQPMKAMHEDPKAAIEQLGQKR
jgi:hypothetical protein